MELIAIDGIIEQLILSLLTKFEVEIAISALILAVMSLGIILMAFLSLVACLVVPPVYVLMTVRFIKESFKKIKKEWRRFK
jgi:hypothetical protein